jgi:protein-disulfide isomerase
MNTKLFMMAFALPVLLVFSGCFQDAGGGDNSKAQIAPSSDNGSENQEKEQKGKDSSASSSDLDENRIREIVREEIAMADLSNQIQKGIDNFISEQEEAARKAQEEANKPVQVEGVSADDDPFMGDPDAPVTIIEFSDYECPFCKRHVEQVFPEIKENYIDTGIVKYVFRDFPLGFHQNAFPAAVAANCALEQSDNETYFEYHDLLFADQQNLNEEAYLAHAEELDLNVDAFEDCLAINDTSEIENDMEEGAEYGISGTPGFFVNGWMIKGAYPYSEFEKFIEQELAAE